MLNSGKLSKYKDAFINEAELNVNEMNRALLYLEKFPYEKSYFHQMYCSVHTLKSLATTMNYRKMVDLCHLIEDLLEAINDKCCNIASCSDLLFKCFDCLNGCVRHLYFHQEESGLDDIIMMLENYLLSIENRTSEKIQRDLEKAIVTERNNSIDVKVEIFNSLFELADKLYTQEKKLASMRDKVENAEILSSLDSLSNTIKDFKYHLILARLVPIEFVFSRFMRMTRDLARQQGKEIDLLFEGGDLELDRFIMNEVSSSIMHLVKNAIDHGIELPQVREQQGKPMKGMVILSAQQSEKYIIIKVTDDGAGLDMDKIHSLALSRNIVKERMREEDKGSIIFLGISTKSVITKVSGRGFGLPIVKQKIESLGGSVVVTSQMGKQTTFQLNIPLTLDPRSAASLMAHDNVNVS